MALHAAFSVADSTLKAGPVRKMDRRMRPAKGILSPTASRLHHLMESSDAITRLELIDFLAYLMHIACNVIALILRSFIWHELCSFPV